MGDYAFLDIVDFSSIGITVSENTGFQLWVDEVVNKILKLHVSVKL